MTTQADVDALRAALKERREGRAVASISSAGRSVAYQAMTLTEMEDALARAEAELAAGGKPRRRGALRVVFG